MDLNKKIGGGQGRCERRSEVKRKFKKNRGGRQDPVGWGQGGGQSGSEQN